jgi:hypothetical protein
MEGQYKVGNESRETYILDAIGESGFDMPEYLMNSPLGGSLILERQRGCIHERESKDLRCAILVNIMVDIDGCGAYVGCMTAATLHELCDGGELVLGGCWGDFTGVQEKTQKGSLAGALTSDHNCIPTEVV